jgi:hypothetical protein
MVTELFPLKLEFRELSDQPDGDPVDAPDIDDLNEDEDDDLLKGGDDDNTSDSGDPIE